MKRAIWDAESIGTYEPMSTVTQLGDLLGRGEIPFHRLSPLEKNAVESEAAASMLYLDGRSYETDRWDAVLSTERRRYQRRMGVKAAHITTMLDRENTRWMMRKLRRRIRGKTVVEIGAGLGVFAIEMAKVAQRVFAIESDPEFTREFVVACYQSKPANLTWIFDTAESVLASGLGLAMKADVAVVVTGSDEEALRSLAEQFVASPDAVVLPWQDWNGGKAMIDYKGRVAPCKDRQQVTFPIKYKL